MRERTKNYLSTILLFGILVAVWVVGILFYNSNGYFSSGTTFMFLLLALVGVIANAVINIFLHEIGHVIFGFISGYKLDFVSIGFLQFSKRGVKISFKKGFGRTSMTPRNTKHFYSKMFFYLLGGSIMSLALCVASIFFMFYDFQFSYYLYIFLSTGFFIHPYFFFREILPYSSSINESDGDKMLGILTKSKKMQLSLKLFTIQSMLMSGTSPKDIDANLYFDVPIVQDNMTERILLENYRYLYYIDTDNREGIDTSAEFMRANVDDILDIYYDGIMCDLFFYNAYFAHDFETAEKIYVDIADFLNSQTNIVNLQYKMAFALYIEKDYKKAIKLANDALSMKNDYIISGIACLEEKLIASMLSQAKQERENTKQNDVKKDINFTEFKG